MCSLLQHRMRRMCVLVVGVSAISSSIFVLLSFNIHSGVRKCVAYSMDTHLIDNAHSSYDSFQIRSVYTSTKEMEKFFGEVNTDMTIWTFQERVQCRNNTIDNQFATKLRRKFLIECSKDAAKVAYSWTSISSDILTMEFGDSCLSLYVTTYCGRNYTVPNVVHFVWYMRGKLKFVPFLSILSVIRFVKPCAIIFHGDLPTGSYWDAIVYFYPNIIHLKRKRPTHVFGIKIRETTHSSDIMRLEALTKYGGIYMDTDTILVRPLKNLMDYPFILSNQSNGVYGSAFIMSERNASFLQLWLNEYKTDYRPKHYIYNAMLATKKLAQNDTNKDLIHVEYGTISRPKGLIGRTIYKTMYATYNWSNIYGMHMYIRIHKQFENEITIRNTNNTFASVCRHVFYGNKELCL